MERDNFDKDFRIKLENRKIVPSDTAWERLEAQLTAQHHPQKRRKPLYWIAASVAILLMSSLYFTNFNGKEETPSVVENDVPNKILPSQKVNINNTNIDKDRHIVEEEAVKEKAVPMKKNSVLKTSTRSVQEAVAKNTSTKTAKNPIAPTPFEDEKVEEVVAKIQQLQQHNKTVTDAEIHALLVQAQHEIHLKRNLTDTSGKVDAMALLADVEEEVDQSFKDKVFEALKEGFFKVRTAVAERNN